jgi:hypothetical protein
MSSAILQAFFKHDIIGCFQARVISLPMWRAWLVKCETPVKDLLGVVER